MCPAIHIKSHSWLCSSSTHELSDPPLRAVCISEMPSRGALQARCKMLLAGFLPVNCAQRVFRFLCSFACFTCPKHALVWGNCCEWLRIEIFVRVLRSSRVNLSNVNDTNVFCCVWIESPFIYFLLQFSILCYKSSVGNKVQFLVESL